jgi:hypothetical protein
MRKTMKNSVRLAGVLANISIEDLPDKVWGNIFRPGALKLCDAMTL